MAEYVITGDTMTEIADAIREKTKTAAAMKPGQMAALIEGIETGGGGSLPAGVSALASGTITLDSDSISTGLYTIEHGMGKAPSFYMIAIKGTVSASEHAGYLCLAYCADTNLGGSGGVRGFVDTITSSGNARTDMNFSSGMDTVMFSDNTFALYLNNRPLKAGTTYVWVCGTLDGME